MAASQELRSDDDRDEDEVRGEQQRPQYPLHDDWQDIVV